jgi:radical SAM superfamily enzyme YgiQ (UPF0313 family)
MKIVLVQPRTFHTWEALNIGYLAAYVKMHAVADLEFYSGFFDTDEAIVSAGSTADIVGFSVTSPQFKHALALARTIKKKNSRTWIVFGGVHPSVLPDEVLATGLVDAVVTGEGEKAFLSIVEGDRSPKISAPFIENLDELPMPDRFLIKQERNIAQAYQDNGIRIASIFSSRGCPQRCMFCASHCVWTRRVRFRSPENVLEEFEKVVKDLKIDFIKFSDDTFTVRKSLVQKFCEGKIRNKNTTPWGCNIRVEIDKETLEIMKAANCKEVWIGVESGSPKILEQMKKGITVEQVRRVFEITHEMGFYRRAYMLLGMPEESIEDIKLSESLVQEIKPEAVGFTILAPYPGTSFYDAEQHKNVDWSAVDEYGNDMTRTRSLTNQDLKREQARLVSVFSDRLVYRHLKKN